MDFEFNKQTQQVLENASQDAYEDRCSHTTVYHLLSILINMHKKKIPGGQYSKWKDAINKERLSLERLEDDVPDKPPYDDSIIEAFDRANDLRIENKSNVITTEDITEVLIKTDDPVVKMEDLVQKHSNSEIIDKTELNQELPKTSILSKICDNFTQKAKLNKYDPVVGREKEIKKVIRILLKRKKNNPILLGEAGVGKTAIIEGIAQRLETDKDNPLYRSLKNIEILGLNLMSLIGGTSHRGDLEKRLNDLIDELEKKSHKYILFIDEAHNLVGAGKSEGSADLANYLKPALARGEISIIGATTYAEYKRFIEPDAALKRRMEVVHVNELTVEETKQILKEAKPLDEKRFNVIYDNQVIENIPEWAIQYFSEERLPDSALNLLQNIGSYVAVETTTTKTSESSTVNIQKAVEYIEEEKGIDKESIILGVNQRLISIKKYVKVNFIGQEKALQSLYTQMSKLGIPGYPRRNITSLLFWGAMGGNKIDAAFELAEYLFSMQKKIFYVDLASYSHRESIYNLIGPPRGIQGYQDGGELTEFVKRNSQCCIILSNMNHCHPNVMRIFIEPLRHSTITDNARISYPFHNAFMIFIADSLNRVKQVHGDEILNLIQNKIEFHKPDSNLQDLLFQDAIDEVIELLDGINYKLEIDPQALDLIRRTIIESQNMEDVSKNSIQNAVKEHLEDPVTTYIIENKVYSGTILVKNDNEKLSFSHISDNMKK